MRELSLDEIACVAGGNAAGDAAINFGNDAMAVGAVVAGVSAATLQPEGVVIGGVIGAYGGASYLYGRFINWIDFLPVGYR